MRSALFFAGCLLAACGGGGGGGPGEVFGLTQRVEVTTLTFPTGLAQPAPVNAVIAFPNLSFSGPVYFTEGPDGRCYVVEQGGRIRVFAKDPATSTSSVFLTVSVAAGGERGLYAIAFHPDFAANGFFYVHYAAPATGSEDHRTTVSRFTANAGVVVPGSELVLLDEPQPFSNHNGGMIAFGPDGKLYVAIGDGGSANDPQNNGQDRTNVLGTVLRLNDDGTIPADNPFVGAGGGVREEIWAYGLRNPWRFSFDRNTGALWLGDVGQSTQEEIDIVVRGGNYGWRLFEGDLTFNNPGGQTPADYVPPVQTYGRGLGISVTGGFVYRGTALPSLAGAYIYADFGSGRVWALVHDGNQKISNTEIVNTNFSISSFGEDADGEIYFCSFNGRIYRFEESGGGSAPTFPQTLSATGLFSNTAAMAPAPGVVEYAVNAEFWSDGARKRRWIALPGQARIAFDATEAWTFPVGTAIVKHFEIDVSPGTVRRLETRVLLLTDGGWQGYTYKWNGAGTDADLLAEGEDEVVTVNGVDQTWRYPSRSECFSCHTTAAGRILGVRTRQLNRDFSYPARVDNQLRSWNHIGLFTTDIGAATVHEALPDPFDPSSGTVAARARAYLAANCAMCHQPFGPTPSAMDLRYATATSATNTIHVTPATPVIPGNAIIRPGSRSGSDLWERLRRTDQFRMPQLARNVPHQAAIDLIGAWIDVGAD